MLGKPVSLSYAAYEVLWERAELGVMPVSVAITYPLRTLDSGAALAATAFAELNAAELTGESDDTVHPDLTAALRMLARAPLRCFAMCVNPANPQGKGPLVAVKNDAAVLAELDGTRLHLTPVPPDGAVRALVAAVAPGRPGRGPALYFRADALTADGTKAEPRAAEGSMLVAPTAVASDVDRYLALMRRPRTAVTYLYAERDGRRCTHPLVAVDVVGAGRWLTGRDDTWISAAPGTPETLVDQLTALSAGPSGGD